MNDTKEWLQDANVKVISLRCVNSDHLASWIDLEKEKCECPFGCKITIEITANGHPPHSYVVTEQEYKSLYLATPFHLRKGDPVPIWIAPLLIIAAMVLLVLALIGN